MSVNVTVALPLEAVMALQAAANGGGNPDLALDISTQTISAAMAAVKDLPYQLTPKVGHLSFAATTPIFTPRSTSFGSGVASTLTAKSTSFGSCATLTSKTACTTTKDSLTFEELQSRYTSAQQNPEKERKRIKEVAQQLERLITAAEQRNPEIMEAAGLYKAIINFSVKTLTGKTIPVSLVRTATMSDLAWAVEAREGIPPNMMRLIFNGATLWNGEDMADMEDDEGMRERTIGEVSFRALPLPNSVSLMIAFSTDSKPAISSTWYSRSAALSRR